MRDRMGFVRSKLFVPGSRPELFTKAAATQADALSFDLEDSVVESKKHEAREAVASFLKSRASATARVFIARVNPLNSRHFHADITAVVVPGLHVINVPKVESRDDVLATVAAIEACERDSAVTSVIGIVANIETPKGLRLAYEIASAHPRVVGLQLGFLDLSLACGIDLGNIAALNAVRLNIRIAAAEADVAAFDGAFANVKNLDMFRTQAEQARALGLNGKSCIHPAQVAIANDVFTPDADAVSKAARIVQAAEAAKDTGAFLLDGSMIDLPVLTRARRLLSRAQFYGDSFSTEGESVCQP
jgi:citrate lyase subunit beta/citryl-CoA lyase